MSRKDYVVLADGLVRIAPHPDDTVASNMYRECVLAVARTLRNDNSRFDEGRFLAACGVQS